MKYLKSNIIIRNIKLHILFDVPLESEYKSIFEDLKSIFSNLKQIKPYEDIIEASNVIFYIKEDTDAIYLFRLEDKHHKEIWVDKCNIWERILNNHKIYPDDISNLISWYLTEFNNMILNIQTIPADLKEHKEYLDNKYLNT